jgi:hypothetical protein
MSYSVVKTDGDVYNLLEKDSGTVIDLNAQEDAARSLCRKLNLGSGFAGWTPEFMAKKLFTSRFR